MGQEPNIELEPADRPRTVARVGVPRRWTPTRPGDITAPEQMPGGPGFGRIGPGTGFALKLVGRAAFEFAEGENHHDAEYAIALIAGARASLCGRSPTVEDVEVALTLCGYRSETNSAAFARARSVAFANLAHNDAHARALIDAIPSSVLLESPADVAARIRAGERFLSD